jgi:hypothetical protein
MADTKDILDRLDAIEEMLKKIKIVVDRIWTHMG